MSNNENSQIGLVPGTATSDGKIDVIIDRTGTGGGGSGNKFPWYIFVALAAVAGLTFLGIQLVKQLNLKKEIEIKLRTPGEFVYFGHYEQDNDLTNGPEAIEWLVYDTDGEKSRLVSKYALDAKAFNERGDSILWADSTIRQWLNNEFLNTAFTEKEKDMIIKGTVQTADNPINGEPGGPDTEDKIYLLSIDEAQKYFPTESDRDIEETPYARANGSGGYWWLRSAADHENKYAVHIHNGRGDFCNYSVGLITNKDGGVRPVLWLNLNSGVYFKDYHALYDK